MLTRIETAGVSGISGVPWDAVELPSQFMENWCWSLRRWRLSLVTTKPANRCQRVAG
ncbi:M3 family metallopeptidase [Escherichia coli]